MTVNYAELDRPTGSWVRDKLFMGQSFGEYMRSLLTPFNAIAAIILAVGIPVAVVRFTQGLAATTNLSNTNPWGLWIGVDVLSGVALAAGGYVMATAVHIFGLKDYRPIVRPAVLTGFLGYFFVVVGLCFDLGRPWRLPFPIFVSYGVTSVMFLVAWHVALYLTCQFVEFCPAVFEWLGWKKVRAWAAKLTLGATVAGVMLSTLHQSALGAMFLLSPTKLHPLWYTPLIPILFFVSSIIAGITMVIVESSLSHRIFSWQVGNGHQARLDRLTLGLGKAASLVLFTYFWLKILGVIHADAWAYLDSPLGQWWMVEMFGFVLLPCFLLLWATRNENAGLVRVGAAIAVAGIVLNRLNVSVIAFNWNVPDRYVPAWTEVVITITIITIAVLTFRWVVNRMPVLRDHPAFPADH